MWIRSQHAADTTAALVAQTGAPVEAVVLDVAEDVATLTAQAGVSLGSGAGFAATLLAASRAVAAGRR